MPFCKNCGHEIKENAKFCDSCGYNLSETITTLESPNSTSEKTPRIITADGSVYEYERGKEIAHYYSSLLVDKNLKTRQIASYIGTAACVIGIFIIKSLISDYENASVSRAQKKQLQEVIGSLEGLVKLFWVALFFLFIASIVLTVLRRLHAENNNICICEHGVYGVSSRLFFTKKFDIPYSVIERASYHIKDGIRSDETLYINTKSITINCAVSKSNAISEEINKRLKNTTQY